MKIYSPVTYEKLNILTHPFFGTEDKKVSVKNDATRENDIFLSLKTQIWSVKNVVVYF